MNSLSTEAAAKLTERIQNAGTEVVDAKVRLLRSKVLITVCRNRRQ